MYNVLWKCSHFLSLLNFIGRNSPTQKFAEFFHRDTRNLSKKRVRTFSFKPQISKFYKKVGSNCPPKHYHSQNVSFLRGVLILYKQKSDRKKFLRVNRMFIIYRALKRISRFSSRFCDREYPWSLINRDTDKSLREMIQDGHELSVSTGAFGAH